MLFFFLGKTGAFSLPLLQIVHETLRDPTKGMSAGGAASAPALHPRQCAMSASGQEEKLFRLPFP